MDKQDADRALDQALTDLEQSRSGADREQMAALLAAVVLIGRRLVPAHMPASEETMSGRRAAPAYPGPAAPRVDPPRKGMRHTAAWKDEPAPTPALRALITGAPIADEVPEPVGAFAWSPGMDEPDSTPDLWPVGGPFGCPPGEVDPLAAKDRAELAATLTELDVARRNLARERAEVLRLNDLRAAAERRAAALHSVIDEARRELARALGADADGTLTWLVSVTGSRIAADRVRVEATERERDGWIRSFSKVGEALDCPAGEPSVLAAISTLKKERDRLGAETESLERDRNEIAASEASAENRYTMLRSSMQTVLGLPANALDSVIVAKVREAGAVIGEARKEIDEARAKLTTTLAPGPCPTGQTLPMLPDLVARAVTHIEVLRSEHARERVTVDELRGMQADMVEETCAAKDAANEHRARWERLRPVCEAIQAWRAGRGRSGGESVRLMDAVFAAFDVWRRAEDEANADDGPADVPHQPDDPGVTESGNDPEGGSDDKDAP
jgi:hypothetical protein